MNIELEAGSIRGVKSESSQVTEGVLIYNHQASLTSDVVIE